MSCTIQSEGSVRRNVQNRNVRLSPASVSSRACVLFFFLGVQLKSPVLRFECWFKLSQLMNTGIEKKTQKHKSKKLVSQSISKIRLDPLVMHMKERKERQSENIGK